jgi:hypothetical protein
MSARRGFRPGGNSLMQVAAAVVGSAAAAQVLSPSEMAEQAHANTYVTQDAPGVTEDMGRLDVVGSNGRKLIATWTPEGLWIGGCLIADRADAEYLADFITREADE